MKKITLILLGVLVSTFSFAGRKSDYPKTTSGMAIMKKDDDSYKLIYKGEERSDVEIRILDAENKVVFSEVIRHSDGFARSYNFKNLLDGDYTIHVDNGSNWLTEKVEINRPKEKVAQLVRIGNSRYMLTVPGRGKDNLSVSIFDNQGNTLHDSNSRVDGDFSRIYDLTKWEGDFYLVVSDKKGLTKSFKR